jgi:hypothetical protein
MVSATLNGILNTAIITTNDIVFKANGTDGEPIRPASVGRLGTEDNGNPRRIRVSDELDLALRGRISTFNRLV